MTSVKALGERRVEWQGKEKKKKKFKGGGAKC